MNSRRMEIINALENLPVLIKEVLTLNDKVKEIADTLYKKKSLLIMGRGYGFATCLEGKMILMAALCITIIVYDIHLDTATTKIVIG